MRRAAGVAWVRSAESSKIACDPEADKGGATGWIVRRARGRAEETRSVAPRTATNDTFSARAAFRCRSVRRRPSVSTLVAILRPFPNIPMHLVQIPRFGLEHVDFYSALAILSLGTSALVRRRFPVIVRLVRCYRRAPPEGRNRRSARHVFAFGFGE